MSEVEIPHTIHELLARPAAQLTPHQIGVLQNALRGLLHSVSEVVLYESVAEMGEDDPKDAMRTLRDREEGLRPVYPRMRAMLMERLGAEPRVHPPATSRTPPEELPGGANDRAREAAFRADPGKHLDGASVSTVQPLTRGFGFVRVGDRDWPWTYAAAAYARSDLKELLTFMVEGGYDGGYLVGAPYTDTDLCLPTAVEFVPVYSNGGVFA